MMGSQKNRVKNVFSPKVSAVNAPSAAVAEVKKEISTELKPEINSEHIAKNESFAKGEKLNPHADEIALLKQTIGGHQAQHQKNLKAIASLEADKSNLNDVVKGLRRRLNELERINLSIKDSSFVEKTELERDLKIKKEQLYASYVLLVLSLIIGALAYLTKA